jgi:hypothetical protein
MTCATLCSRERAVPDEPYRGRVFTPAEVRRILSRAAALEDAAAPGGREAGRGHAREEIERIAADAGISAGALQRALQEEETPAGAPSLPFSLAGAPAHVAIERTVRGSFSASSHPDLARAMRQAVGLGEATHTEGQWGWSSSPFGGRRARALVESSADGRVAVRVEESLEPARAGVFTLAWVVGFAIVLPVLAFIPHGAARAIVPYVLLAWAVLPYFAARALYVRRFRAREAELAALVADLAAVVATAAPPVAEPRVRVMGAADAPEEDADSSEGPIASQWARPLKKQAPR